MANLARILSGNISGSARVVAGLDGGTDGTSIRVYWGNTLMGSGSLVGGLALIDLIRPLATNDILSASVTTQGNQVGPPVLVSGPGIVLGPWVSPTEIRVTLPDGNVVNMPVSLFKETYGYTPSSLENVDGLPTINYPEFQSLPTNSIAFDLSVERQGGQTSVSVQNVQNVRGGILTKWAGDAAWGNLLTKAFTVAGSTSVSVKGSQNTDDEAVLRTVTITIQTPAPATPAPDPRIRFYSWSLVAGQLITVFINTDVDVQVRCLESDSPMWFDASLYNNSHERQCYLPGLPLTGAVTVQIRVRGETDTAKYVTMAFNKYA